MRISLRHLILALPFTLFAAACGDDDDATGPTPTSATVDGIIYTARVDLIRSVAYPYKDPAFFQVTARLENRRAIPLNRAYPAGCPVRIRLVRGGDNAVVYDEARRPCNTEPAVMISVQPNVPQTLSSGLKLLETFRGDSIAEGTYTVFATVQTEGARPVVIRAGTITF